MLYPSVGECSFSQQAWHAGSRGNPPSSSLLMPVSSDVSLSCLGVKRAKDPTIGDLQYPVEIAAHDVYMANAQLRNDFRSLPIGRLFCQFSTAVPEANGVVSHCVCFASE